MTKENALIEAQKQHAPLFSGSPEALIRAVIDLTAELAVLKDQVSTLQSSCQTTAATAPAATPAAQ